MLKKIIPTAQRVSESVISDNYVFQRSLKAYQEAAKLIYGSVLEIGTGSGYGISYISHITTEFITIDKNEIPISLAMHNNRVKFLKMKVPCLKGIPSNYFDFVISFQVIEHIKEDHHFLEEIRRVLKPGGKIILTTPNKLMSLSRNPWHIREYCQFELKELLEKYYTLEHTLGIDMDEKAALYFTENKKQIARIERFDIFKFNRWFPRWALRGPYDLLNRINRRKIAAKGLDLSTSNFFLNPVSYHSLDLFYIASKE